MTKTFAIENRTRRECPTDLLKELERAHYRLQYSRIPHLYFLVWDSAVGVGVIGDGDNGSYEWFIWNDATKRLATSNCGYGSTWAALLDGIKEQDDE